MEITRLFMVKMMIALIASSSMLWAPSMAGESGSSAGCSTVAMSLAPCVSYMDGKSSDPSSECCTEVGNAVKTEPDCLCQLLGGSVSPPGVKIDKKKALDLPGACKLKAPSQCSNTSSPSKSLEKEEGSSSRDKESSGKAPSPSKSNEASISEATIGHMIFALVFFIISYAF